MSHDYCAIAKLSIVYSDCYNNGSSLENQKFTLLLLRAFAEHVR